jgi:tetratricopeptide (TPR) repeat protein
MKPFISKTLIIISILLLGLAASFAVSVFSYNHQTADLKIQEQALIDNFAQKVSAEKDAYKLSIDGLRQMHSNLPNMAIISLARATELEPNYRDAWLAKAACELKMFNTSAALESAKKAEKIDPINAPTYEILQEIYTQTDNKVLAQAAKTKLDFLNKK